MDIDSIAAGMGILTTIGAVVWGVMHLVTNPTKTRVGELVVKDVENTKTVAKLEQRVDHVETAAERHRIEQQAATAELKSMIRDLSSEWKEGIADLRREIREDTGNFRSSPRDPPTR